LFLDISRLISPHYRSQFKIQDLSPRLVTPRLALPNITAHAAFHVVVENQIAEGLASTVNAMKRLMKEGLSRHEALHAVAAVVAEHVNMLMRGKATDVQTSLDSALEKLTVKVWRRRYGA